MSRFKHGKIKNLSKLLIIRNKEDFIIKNYNCNFCNFKFSYFSRKLDSGEGKHNAGSNQIQCLKCNNFIKT